MPKRLKNEDELPGWVSVADVVCCLKTESVKKTLHWLFDLLAIASIEQCIIHVYSPHKAYPGMRVEDVHTAGGCPQRGLERAVPSTLNPDDPKG